MFQRQHRIHVLAGLAMSLFAFACTHPERSDRQPAEHAGRAVCVTCHEREANAWQGSHHDLAMARADATSVLGDFDDAEFTYNRVTSRFFRRDGKFMVRTDGPSGDLVDYEIAYTFGVEPLQQYLIEFPDGRIQTLGVSWDTRPKSEGGQRWFHVYPDEAIDHEDVLHWTTAQQNWNYMCAECHSTELRKNYDVAEDRYDTTWKEIDVSCEACHGPGSGHVDWARDVAEGGTSSAEDFGLTVLLADHDGGSWVFDPDAVSARREPLRRSRAQIETCARCHSRRTQLSDDYRHGRPLEDTHRVALLDPVLYHADGQILDEVYVYGSFRQSKMYREGVTCTDCHDPHTARLLLDGNLTCSPCHQGAHFDTPEHHFHQTGSTGASCVACHMPVRNYMVVDPRHDHGFRIPRPDLSLTIGTPNTCTDCHTNRSAEWAAEKVTAWYGEKPDRPAGYAEAIHAGRNWRPQAGTMLLSVVGDPEAPGIVRATALDLLRDYPAPNLFEAVQRSLRDEDPLVRREAAGTLEVFEPEARARLGFPVLDDPVRTVRLAAARTLAGVPRYSLTEEQRVALDRGLEEYAEVQRFNEDHATGRLNLGWFHQQQGRLDEAEQAYQASLRAEPTFGPAAVNLADLYRMQGRETDGETVLRDALSAAPENADLLHALGLLLVRQKRHDEAMSYLQHAAELAPDRPRYAYVFGVGLHSIGETSRALEVLENAHEGHPGHAEMLLALATVSRDVGDTDSAIVYAERLLDLAPGHPVAVGLLRDLGAGSPER